MDNADNAPRNSPVVMKIVGIAAAAALLVIGGAAGARFLTDTGPLSRSRPAVPAGMGPGSFTTLTDDEDAGLGLPVPPSASRHLALRQSNDPDSVIALYSTPRLAVEHVADFYCEQMPADGWQEANRVEEQLNVGAKGIMLFFRRPGRECLIHLEPEGAGARWCVFLRPVIVGGGRK